MIVKSGPAAIVGACALVAAALTAAPKSATAESAPLHRSLPPSNSAILLDALRGAAGKLAQRAPITPGSRVVLTTEGGGGLALDVRQALLEALTARHIECVLPSEEPGGAAAPAAAPNPGVDTTSHSTVITTTPAQGSDLAGESLGSISASFGNLQNQRREQVARAESLARANAGLPPAPSAVAQGSVSTRAVAAHGELPRLTVRVEEARIDYVRQYRGGLLGAYRVERRAGARLDMRMSSPGSEAVTWTASADSSLGDIVLRSDLPSLENRQRPETIGQIPQAGFKKILEPVLVIALVAGLVSLFYQNRP